MVRLKIFGIAGLFCVMALGLGLVVGRVFSTNANALPRGSSATPTATVLQARTQAPTPTAIVTLPAATDAPPAPTTLPPAPTTAPTIAPTIAPTTAPIAPQATAEASYIEYTVQKGDILYTLAEKYGVTVDDILAINDIANPQSLTVGQVIRIPKK